MPGFKWSSGISVDPSGNENRVQDMAQWCWESQRQDSLFALYSSDWVCYCKAALCSERVTESSHLNHQAGFDPFLWDKICYCRRLIFAEKRWRQSGFTKTFQGPFKVICYSESCWDPLLCVGTLLLFAVQSLPFAMCLHLHWQWCLKWSPTSHRQ